MPDPAPWSGNCDVVSIWKGEASSNVSPTVVEEPVENAVPTFTADQAASDVDNKSNEQKPLVDIVSSEPQLTTPTDNNQNDGVPDIAATLAAQPDTKEEENKEIPEIASESSVSSLDTELEDEDEPTLNIVEEADADSSVDDDEEDDDVDDVPDIGVNEDKESPKPLVDITDAPSDNSGNSDGNLNTNVPTTDTGKPLITLTDE